MTTTRTTRRALLQASATVIAGSVGPISAAAESTFEEDPVFDALAKLSSVRQRAVDHGKVLAAAEEALLETLPSTPAGAIALLRFIAAYVDKNCDNATPEVADTIRSAIAVLGSRLITNS